jgi:hypothetical protein
MKQDEIDEIIQKILKENLSASEAFEVGVDLQKSNSTDYIEQILGAFESRKQEIESKNRKRIKGFELEKEILKFVITAFKASDSYFDLNREFFRKDEIFEGQPNFIDIFGIEEFRTRNYNECSANVAITIKEESILDKATLGLIGNFELRVSNDSGDDSIEVYYDAFESVVINQLEILSIDQIDVVINILKLINSIGIDDYDTFLSICLSLGELDKDWLDKSMFLSQLANDGGKTLAKMISDKYLDEGNR